MSDRLRALPDVQSVIADDAVIDLTLDDSYTVLPEILAEANDAGARVLSVQVKEPDLEEVFLQLTGRALRN